MKPRPRASVKRITSSFNPDPAEKRRIELAQRFGWVCWYCGYKIYVGDGHLDHVIPTCKGGPDVIDNWALACEFCNMAKHSKPLDEFMSWVEWMRSGKSYTPYEMSSIEVAKAEYARKEN